MKRATLYFGVKTDIGRVRRINQDSVAAFAPGKLDGLLDGLFVVADGMGGHAGGEIASRIVVERLPDAIAESLSVLPDDGSSGYSDSISMSVLAGLRAVNASVWRQAQDNPDLRGMGSTCVMTLIRNNTALIGHVGDSRLYLLRSGAFTQITQDHSLVQEYVRAGEMSRQEARGSRFKNVITRAIGLAGSVEPDVQSLPLQPGDTLLLCSDGLTGMVEDAAILETLSSTEDPQVACEELVRMAIENGGDDNISVIVVRYGDFKPAPVRAIPASADTFETATSPTPAMPVRQRKSSGGGFVLFLLLLLIVVLGAALVTVGQEVYEPASQFPFVRHRPAKAPPKEEPKVDFGALLYDAPKALLSKPVKSSTLLVDSSGVAYVVTQTDKLYRVSEAKSEAISIPGLPAPRPDSLSGDHFATDAQSYFYHASSADGCVYKYAPNGTRKAVIGKGQLHKPQSIGIDGKGNLYAIDDNRLVMLRARLPESSPAAPKVGEPAGG